jgi:hypothetical protein
MSGGRSSKRRKRNTRQSAGAPSAQAPAKTSATSAQAPAKTKLRDRVRQWLSSANKLVLASIGTGIAGLITTAVVAVPHLAGNLINPPPQPPPPLAIVGSASPGVQPTNPAGVSGAQYIGVTPATCSVGGVYVVPGAVNLPKTVSTADVTRLLSRAGYANETAGSYLLQASAGQTVVLTGLHTVLLRRVPAIDEKATVLYVVSPCPEAPPMIYDASVDLDAANLTPRLSLINEMTGTTTPVRNLADVTTEDQPVEINFDATAAKYDVTWKLRLDYVVNGKAESAYVPSTGQAFETDAIVGNDPAYTLTNNFTSVWSVQPGRPS